MAFLSNNQDDLAQALDEQKRDMEESAARHQAEQYQLPYLNMRNFPLDLNSMSLLLRNEALNAEAIPFYKEGKELKVATINPRNPLLAEIKKRLSEKYKISLYYISNSSFEMAYKFYDKVMAPTAKFEEIIHTDPEKDYSSNIKNLETENVSVSDLLESLFGGAVNMGASDIHFEPEEHIVKIRYRIDGVLQDIVHLPKSQQKVLNSRIKLMAKLKLNIDNEAQDGRISILNGDESLDVRVSVLPSSFGEALVLRLLGVGSVNLGITDLGLTGKALDVIHEEIKKPNGMIITTGPTGSGKTTTLYAFLRELNKPGVKIITLEDPVEYKVEGIQQTPIDHRVDFSFDKALRSVLRQDPDVVMVGEIRDPETAETALQAALTGHMVLSTLHTNDAVGAVPRLLTMGVKPFIIAPAVSAIIAQRLVRRLCQDCIKVATPDSNTLDKVNEAIKEIPQSAEVKLPKELKFYSAAGCNQCGGLGYKGRVGIYEVIHITEEMKELILTEPSGLQIKTLATKNGSLTMFQDGILKALDKLTDISEVLRVAGV